MKNSKKSLSISLIISIIILISCNSSNKDEIVPREKFINILTELHIADAVLTEKGLYDRKLKDSTDSYYNYIMVKHNMSRSKFDQSLMHYAQDMEDFSLIYDKVVENITAETEAFNRRKSIFNLPQIVLDSINQKEKRKKKKTITGTQEMWTQKKDWSLPEDGKTNSIFFEDKAYGQFKLELSADILIYEDDQTINPTMLIYIFYKDGSNSTFKDTSLVKSGEWKTYKLIAKTHPSKKPSKIVCKVLDHDTGTKEKHLKVKNISLIKSPIKKEPELIKKLNKDKVKVFQK